LATPGNFLIQSVERFDSSDYLSLKKSYSLTKCQIPVSYKRNFFVRDLKDSHDIKMYVIPSPRLACQFTELVFNEDYREMPLYLFINLLLWAR
jgi:hypothetical protein